MVYCSDCLVINRNNNSNNNNEDDNILHKTSNSLTASIMTTVIIIIIIITTKTVKFFLIINLHTPKITIVMFQLQVKLILVLLIEVRILKNVTKLTITITSTIIIVIVIIMKTITTTKVLLIIKLIATRRHQPQIKNVVILGDSMVKNLNGFLLTRKLNHKCLLKSRPFKSASVIGMHNHPKPIVQDFDSDHIILNCGTNDLNSDRVSSQIAREIVDLALSLSLTGTKFQFPY